MNFKQKMDLMNKLSLEIQNLWVYAPAIKVECCLSQKNPYWIAKAIDHYAKYEIAIDGKTPLQAIKKLLNHCKILHKDGLL